MRGLTIVVAGGDRARFRSALTLACAHAALGGPARLYADAAAVPLLADTEALLDARELGVTLIACQTGLAKHNMTAGDLAHGVATGGMVGLLADLGDDRLLTV